MIPKTILGTLLAGCFFSVATGWAGDWPQWRGPDRTDISSETGLLRSWPAGGPERVWLYEDAGRGYAGPAIVKGRLITMGTEMRDGQEQEVVLTLDAGTGAKLWSAPITAKFDNSWGHGPRGTPTVAGDHIYALSGNGTLVCLEFEGGTEIWRVSFTGDLGGTVPGWGYTESVLVDGDKVICTPGGDQGALAALDAKTGKVLWRSREFTEGAQYSSPILLTHDSVRQVVQLTMKALVGVAVEDGRLLWKTDWPGRTAVIPTPIARDGYVYVTSGYGVGCMLIKLGDGPEPEQVYANREMKNHHGGVILLGDHVYGHSDGVDWLCQEFLTGSVVWTSDKLSKGAIGYADGHFYCLEEGSGTVVLIEASTAGWNEKGRFTLEPQSRIRERSGRVWTHPVISNGRLYLRDQEYIYCFDVSG